MRVEVQERQQEGYFFLPSPPPSQLSSAQHTHTHTHDVSFEPPPPPPSRSTTPLDPTPMYPVRTRKIRRCSSTREGKQSTTTLHEKKMKTIALNTFGKILKKKYIVHYFVFFLQARRCCDGASPTNCPALPHTPSHIHNSPAKTEPKTLYPCPHTTLYQPARAI